MSGPYWQDYKRKDVIEVPRLEPKDLYDRRRKRDFARLRAYNTLLEQIYHRVYASSKLPGNTSSIIYNVPPFILGLPKLDMEDCIVYIVFQLRQTGFEVKFTWPNLLGISWRHHEGKYLLEQNPIMQAMMPEPVISSGPPMPKGGSQKKKGASQNTSTYSQDVNTLTSILPSSHSPFGSLAQAPRRSAAEYQPPSSFLQTMDRPGPGREQPLYGMPYGGQHQGQQGQQPQQQVQQQNGYQQLLLQQGNQYPQRPQKPASANVLADLWAV
jgi:hypothetical protein